MKKLTGIILLSGLIAAFNIKAESEVTDLKWETCVSERAGVSFLCDPSWKLNQQGRTLTITIAEEPKVTMVVEETEQAVHFMSELSRSGLESMGRYAPGFHIERFRHCERETVKVNGYLKDDPATRVSDFYLLDHLHLHAVKFSVTPQEVWEDYKWVVKKIVDNIEFRGYELPLKFTTEETDETCEELISTQPN
ncbi:MAG TPA: hypothetical protein VI749_02565 [Candidatus Omnitrophota bacterium]|nr:hypothetical protein [Candidatus Omnitrophota bacterium]